jgi:fermentation-respiration switch protein FrsA (DUF1100 family)
LPKILVTILIVLVAGALLFYFVARWFERSVVFHPERYAEGSAWRVPKGAEDVWFKGRSGERLHGWYMRAVGVVGDGTSPHVIYFHGNGGNINTVGWMAEALSQRGIGVLLFDYRGYGRSEGRASDEQAIYEDADAAYDYLVRERNVRPDEIALYGQSLGTTAAVDLASRKPCRAVILESGLSSASDMAALILPSVPVWVHRYGRNHFESAKKLDRVSAPVMVAHGTRDQTIPVEQGYKLYAAARDPKRLRIVENAGHNDLVSVGGKEYLDEVAAFIKTSGGL